MVENHQLGRLIKMISNNFDKLLNHRITDIQLTSAQCDVLAYLHHHQDSEVNPVDLERAFHMQKPTVSGILKRLEEKKFIRMLPGSTDSRYKRIVLTAKAMEHHQLVIKNIDELNLVMFDGISDEEKEELWRLLSRMLNNITD